MSLIMGKLDGNNADGFSGDEFTGWIVGTRVGRFAHMTGCRRGLLLTLAQGKGAVNSHPTLIRALSIGGSEKKPPLGGEVRVLRL